MRQIVSTFSKRRYYGDIVIAPAGRDEIWFIEGSHRINVVAELSRGEYDRVVVRDSIKTWEPPFESEMITIEKRAWIIKLISKYLDGIGENFLIQ